MRPHMLPQVIFAIKSFATFIARMLLVAGMNHRMETQLFLSFKRFQAMTQVWSFGIMRLFVTRQVILSFQCRIANFASENGLRFSKLISSIQFATAYTKRLSMFW